jgi:hypothetical protein
LFPSFKNARESSAGKHSDLDQKRKNEAGLSGERAKPYFFLPETVAVVLISRNH